MRFGLGWVLSGQGGVRTDGGEVEWGLVGTSLVEGVGDVELYLTIVEFRAGRLGD